MGDVSCIHEDASARHKNCSFSFEWNCGLDFSRTKELGSLTEASLQLPKAPKKVKEGEISMLDQFKDRVNKSPKLFYIDWTMQPKLHKNVKMECSDTTMIYHHDGKVQRDPSYGRQDKEKNRLF